MTKHSLFRYFKTSPEVIRLGLLLKLPCLCSRSVEKNNAPTHPPHASQRDMGWVVLDTSTELALTPLAL